MIISTASFALVLDQGRRRDLLTEAADKVRQARSDLAALYAVEAMIRLQKHYPQAATTEFRATQEPDGLAVTIVRVCDGYGDLLYAEDDDRFEYFDDQSEVGDMFAAALEADRRFFAGSERHAFTWSTP